MGGVLTLAEPAVGILSAIAILAGGVVLLAAGRGRGGPAGIGFFVLAAGTLTGSLWSLLLTGGLVDETGTSFSSTFAIRTAVQLVFDAIGWTLLLLAVKRLPVHGASPTADHDQQRPHA